MPVTPQSLRNAADFMQKASGVDPVWLREAAAEIEQLRERLGPRGLEVIEIDGSGHYVNQKVKAEIERLREENRHFRAATVAAMTNPSIPSKER